MRRGSPLTAASENVTRREGHILCVCAVVAALTGVSDAASAQDSVANTPGGNDALSAHDAQRVRFVVDAVPFSSSWGGAFVVAPILKSSRDTDPLFRTRPIAASAISADVRTDIVFPSASFSRWTARGQGVNPTANVPTSLIQVSSFSRQFGVAFGDFTLAATNIVGAVVGQRLSDPSRLFVTRTVAAVSRPTPGGADRSTLTLGAVDSSGFLTLRADDFNTLITTSGRVIGDAIVRINLPLRNGLALNWMTEAAGANIASDAAATTFVIDQTGASLSPPSVIPATMTADAFPIVGALGFDNQFWTDSQPPTPGHLAPGVFAHRGTSSYSASTALGGDGGTLACLAFSTSTATSLDCISVFAVDQLGAVVDSRAAHLPTPITDGASFTAQNPRFIHWKNQTVFRGGNGHVGVGENAAGEVVIAATASDSATGHLIAVARLATGGPEWTVAAHIDKPVLNGPSGAQIGRIVSGSLLSPPAAVAISAPAVDLLGNIYFVAAYKPNLGPAGTALIKAVNTASGYRLERLLCSGQIFQGVNSTRDYEIVSLALGDVDSVSSATFFSGSLLQTRLPDSPPDPQSPLSFGGLVASAVIRYDNNFSEETYDAVLFVGPFRARTIVFGDINGDGVVSAADLGLLLGAWASSNSDADLNGDGQVNAADLALLLGAWG